MTAFYKSLSHILHLLPAMQSLRKAAGEANARFRLSNLPASMDMLVFAGLYSEEKRNILLVFEDAKEAERAFDDLAKLLGEEKLVLFSQVAQQSSVKQELRKNTAASENFGQILEALEKLTQAKEPLVIVADAESLCIPLPGAKSFTKETLGISVGETLGYDFLTWWLREHRFEEKQFVETSGDYAIRGGIVDIFPFTETVPFRIEFFGDTIESIREFDAISQRSIAHRQDLSLVPNALEAEGIERKSSIFDYLDERALVAEFEPALIESALEKASGESIIASLKEHTHFLITNFASPEYKEIDFGGRHQLSFNANLKVIRENIHKLVSGGNEVLILSETKELMKRMEDLLESGETEHDIQIDESNDILFSSETEVLDTKKGKIVYRMPSLAHGFLLPVEAKKVVFTEHELFGRRRDRGASSRKRASRAKGISLRELRTLKRGDLLVHEDKGIGKFMGLDTIEVRGAKQEVVRLSYRDNDVLFVNLDYIAKLSRYSAAEVAEGSVTLSKLGSAAWQRTKEKTKKRLKDIARNLISIYAKRKKQEGFVFSKDDIIQREMEAAFLYEDTPDQAKATEDLKRDMETGAPMDRLICGDVGYGKTEVAMRAAMKATLDKKQVAVLVPTTILAEQHERSFKDRLERFGVAVASISRFKSTKEQKEVLAKLAEGKIDVLIGTHRLLSKDVLFKDLGLLIIDEEHRFGVAAKEKLRELRATVDTLTLTATPIPRTLNFSLLGARDLSVIETPPKNRLPIITEILTDLGSETIRQALRREMERGGQIYAINDKVMDIELYAQKLKELAPRARVGIVHGQLTSTAIEKAMRDFLERRIDILCATKIVESGLDVPNANTIIINHANNFGLAELYQLRGRVGRSNEQAYCYLVTPPIKQLSKDSLRRLEAMEEFSDLGAGFQLAMRDMEIRGAGNLLGAEQSGFINEIGFDLFQKTLAEAVDELKEEEFKDLFKDQPVSTSRNAFIRRKSDEGEGTSISLGVDALIPEHYIEDDAERFGFYQRFASAANKQEIDDLLAELQDRFGAVPEEALNLSHVTYARHLAVKLGFKSVAFEEATRSLRISLPAEDQSEYYQKFFPLIIDKFEAIGQSKIRLVNEGKKLKVIIRLQATEPAERLKEVEKILLGLQPVQQVAPESVQK
ncbi:MAG: transcription-repair coupling factor [Bacteroidota bacterium]|nr:transcription-repair coupling factor [Bacteroidota bacterium]MDP4231038.1 transcription-repair coupling factor [Bacteroidota bacterium]MDP4234984.1 transcription-repair coupling factor [Bacteroidota bacterium]